MYVFIQDERLQLEDGMLEQLGQLLGMKTREVSKSNRVNQYGAKTQQQMKVLQVADFFVWIARVLASHIPPQSEKLLAEVAELPDRTC